MYCSIMDNVPIIIMFKRKGHYTEQHEAIINMLLSNYPRFSLKGTGEMEEEEIGGDSSLFVCLGFNTWFHNHSGLYSTGQST